MWLFFTLCLPSALAARIDEAALVWAWPSGLDTAVRVDVEEVVTAGGEARRRCFSVQARLRTLDGPDGLGVWFADPTDVLPADECPEFVELRPHLPPRFAVAAGAIVSPSPARETLEFWNRMVGFWAGRTVRRTPEAVRVSRATPALGWEPNDLETSARLSDVVRKRDEVEVTLDLTPDPADVTAYFVRLHAAAPELGGVVGNARLSESVRVVADPLTLVPSLWVETRSVTLEMADPPGSARRELTTRWTFGEPSRRGDRKTEPGRTD